MMTLMNDLTPDAPTARREPGVGARGDPERPRAAAADDRQPGAQPGQGAARSSCASSATSPTPPASRASARPPSRPARRSRSLTSRPRRRPARRRCRSSPAPPTPWNKSDHGPPPLRHAHDVSSSDIKRLKDATGGTVNDIVMAICAGALRDYLIEHDALPDRPLRAMVPVSIRTGDEEEPWTNRVSGLVVDLPDQLRRPARAGRRVPRGDGPRPSASSSSCRPRRSSTSRSTRRRSWRRRRSGWPPGCKLADRIDAAGQRDDLQRARARASRSTSHGARMRTYIPVSTIAEGMGLNITVHSYLDELEFGLIACRELVPDLWDMVDLHIDEIAVLFEATGAEWAERPAASPAAAAAPARRSDPAKKAAAKRRRRAPSQEGAPAKRQRRRQEGDGKKRRRPRRRRPARASASGRPAGASGPRPSGSAAKRAAAGTNVRRVDRTAFWRTSAMATRARPVLPRRCCRRWRRRWRRRVEARRRSGPLRPLLRTARAAATSTRCSLLPGFGDQRQLDGRPLGLLGAVAARATGPIAWRPRRATSAPTATAPSPACGHAASRSCTTSTGAPSRWSARASARHLRPARWRGERPRGVRPAVDHAGQPVPHGRGRPQRRPSAVASRSQHLPRRRRWRLQPDVARAGPPGRCSCRRRRSTPAPTAWRRGRRASTSVSVARREHARLYGSGTVERDEASTRPSCVARCVDRAVLSARTTGAPSPPALGMRRVRTARPANWHERNAPGRMGTPIRSGHGRTGDRGRT